MVSADDPGNQDLRKENAVCKKDISNQ
jgi:hypothetical protein